MADFDYKKLVADLTARFNASAAAEGLRQRLQWEENVADRNGGEPKMALLVAQALQSCMPDLKAEVLDAALLLSAHPHLAQRAQKDAATAALYQKLHMSEAGRLWPGQSEEERQVVLAYEIVNLRHITHVMQAGGYVTANHIAPLALSARSNLEMLQQKPLGAVKLETTYQTAAQIFLAEAQKRYSYLFPHNAPGAAGKPRRP